ncbi:MAG: pyridoxal phosphate-dependent aminotransferase [Firmicutes bacterium]|nr:pyridoxal phosphate-dependent aminotransferase [Bacillota bacterium]
MSLFYDLILRIQEMERQGKKIVKLNIGETNLPTPVQAVEAAVRSLQTIKSDYVSPFGLPELRETLAAREKCSFDNIVVGCGGRETIIGLILALTKEGDKVGFPAPFWPAFPIIAKELGRIPVPIHTDYEKGWLFDEIDFSKINFLIICNPLNPSSIVYPEELIRKTLDSAEKAGVPVLIDGAYHGLAYEKVPNYEKAIRVKSFSKEFNMEGWRLGYAVAPDPVVEKVAKYNQLTLTCVPDFIQRAGIACIENEETILNEMKSIWKERQDVACSLFEEAGFRFVKPQSGMYIFATHEKITDGTKFCMDLLDQGIAVAPGESFGNYDRYFRMAVNADRRTIQEVAEKISAYISGL